jgi:hypothetical protein
MSAAGAARDVVLFSSDQDQAATLVAQSVLEGDERQARVWALEYAIHRDSGKTQAELKVSLDVYEERHPLRVGARA